MRTTGASYLFPQKTSEKHRGFRTTLSRVLPRLSATHRAFYALRYHAANNSNGGVMSIASKLAAVLVGGLIVAGTAGTALAGSLPTGRAEDVGMSSERLARIGPALRKHVDAGEIAGAVTLVARRGVIVHHEAHGYADIAKRTPMRTDAIFGLASSSKPITAVAIMMLVESGDVRLNDPVSRYIPEFGAPAQVAVAKQGGAEGEFELVAATRPITVADLLKHGSGLMSSGLGQRAAGQSAQRAPQDTLAT
jgi:CubicO group peptidase (beta-lactamase class C family)